MIALIIFKIKSNLIESSENISAKGLPLSNLIFFRIKYFYSYFSA